MTRSEDPGSGRVAIADEQAIEVDLGALERAAAWALDAAGIPHGHALSIALVDRARIAELKARFYGEHRATDVLSFPMDPLDAPGEAQLGDVVICVAVAARQARALGVPLERELEHLLVHGILHLAGRDHADPADEVAMAREERRILGLMRAAS